MTTKDERYLAIKNTHRFLRSLLDPKETPRVPRKIRIMARSLLKHYPQEYEVERMEKYERETNTTFERNK
jgi:hypothetical protein